MNNGYEDNSSFVDLLGSLRVFAHDISTVPNFKDIAYRVTGLDKYDRVLSIAKPHDIIFLKAHPDRNYLRWLKEVGLGSRKVIVLNGNSEESLYERILRRIPKEDVKQLFGSIQQQKQMFFSPFYAGALEKQASEYLGLVMYSNSSIANKLNSKVAFKELCQNVGVPVIKGAIFVFKQGIQMLLDLVEEQLLKTGKVIIRGEVGASASSTYILNHLNKSELSKLMKKSKPGDRFLIEPFLEVKSSPSSTWFITFDKRICHLKTSRQILDEDTSHRGNEFPVKFNKDLVKEYSYMIALHLVEQGFVGPFGLDFIETKEGLFVVECNPRVTGAMYPWELVHQLEKFEPIRAARAENIVLHKKGIRFSDLLESCEEVLYDGTASEGIVIPYNIGPLVDGKLTVLVTGSSPKEVQSLFDYIKTRLEKL